MIRLILLLESGRTVSCLHHHYMSLNTLIISYLVLLSSKDWRFSSGYPHTPCFAELKSLLQLSCVLFPELVCPPLARDTIQVQKILGFGAQIVNIDSNTPLSLEWNDLETWLRTNLAFPAAASHWSPGLRLLASLIPTSVSSSNDLVSTQFMLYLYF